MKIAVGSDMGSGLAESVVKILEEQGHQVVKFGALVEPQVMWSKVGYEVAQRVADGTFDQAVLFCWTGTGISIAANKVKGIRAALCFDAETARGARKWNDANILAMSLRLTSKEIAREIVIAWLGTDPSEDADDQACLAFLASVEN